MYRTLSTSVYLIPRLVVKYLDRDGDVSDMHKLGICTVVSGITQQYQPPATTVTQGDRSRQLAYKSSYLMRVKALYSTYTLIRLNCVLSLTMKSFATTSAT
jgi:hypothetical protein